MRHKTGVIRSTSPLQTVLALRVLGIAVFPLATVLVAVLQRSWLMVAVLALAMLAASHVERLRLARLMEVKTVPSLAGFIAGTALRSGALLGLFVVCTGILALFRDTSLAGGLDLTDLLIAGGALGIALIANETSARMASKEASVSLASLQAVLKTARGESGPDDGVIIEGEVIQPDDSPPR